VLLQRLKIEGFKHQHISTSNPSNRLNRTPTRAGLRVRPTVLFKGAQIPKSFQSCWATDAITMLTVQWPTETPHDASARVEMEMRRHCSLPSLRKLMPHDAALRTRLAVARRGCRSNRRRRPGTSETTSFLFFFQTHPAPAPSQRLERVY